MAATDADAAARRGRRGDTAQIDIYLIDLRATDDAVGRLRRLLDPDEIAEADRLALAEHARRFCVRRGLRREIFGRRLGADPRTIRYELGRNGKPRLRGVDGLYFNASHSADRALLGVTGLAPLGVDIEMIKDVPDRDAVVRRFFSAAEQDAYQSLADHDRRRAFYYGWTRKEAYIKATGEGLRADLAAFDVTLRPDQPAQIVTIDGSVDRARQWRLVDLAVGDAYAGAVAIRPPADAVVEIRAHRIGA